MALLNRKYALLGIEDVEAFCARIVERRRLDWLLWHERDALITYLVEVCWEQSRRFEPRGYPFSQWVRPTLELRTVDWIRATLGRSKWQFAGHAYERERPEFVSLDADDSEHDRLGTALPGSGGIVVNIAWPMSSGVSKREVAVQVGETTGWVSARLAELRRELERLNPR
jgi:hypothetical protein